MGTGPPQTPDQKKNPKKQNPRYDTHIQADTQMENDLAEHCYTNTTCAALSLLPDLFSISHSCSVG